MSRYYYQPGFTVEGTDIFSSVFSVEEGNKRYPVVVKLKSNAIDFSYVKINMQHPIHPEVVIPWFSVNLKENEHTDFFMQHAHDYEKKVSVDNNANFHIHYFWGLDNKDFLKNEPFIKSISVRHLLLCLFDDLNNPLGDFRKYSPEITETVLSKLNESKIYKLIWRKYSFYRELYDYETSKHPEYYNRLKVLYAEYLPLLMDDVYYKEIPYKTLQKDDFWLQNPEQELEKLTEINKKYSIDDDSLKPIQNYFLKRHAILNALKINAGNLFIPIIATSALAGLLFLINWICWLNGIFKHTTWIWGTGVFFFASSLILLATRKNFINMIMPRIFVAVLSILFVLVGAEELFTRMINVNTFGVAITAFLCLIIITFFLFSESRQHSPAYKVSIHPKMYNIKIVPILVHAFNFANVLVLGLQLVVMPQMVERSDYIKSNKYADALSKIEYTLKDCEEFYENVSKLEQYHDNPSLTNNSAIYKDRLELKNYIYLDTLFGSMLNERFKAIQYPSEVQVAIHKGQIIDSLRFILTHFYGTIQQYKILKEICTYQPNTTKLLATYPFNSPFSKIYELTPEQEKVIIMIKPLKRDCFSFDLKNKLGDKILFPALMMMQVCISLLLGIVGQLIISDKTVTEAL